MEYVISAIALLAILFLITAVKPVPHGYEYTVERFGRHTVTLKPGLNIIMPLVDRVSHKVNMMENVLDIPRQDIITSDNVLVHVDGVVFFQVQSAEKASYVVAELEYAILNLTITNARTVMGTMSLTEALSKRGEINSRLLSALDEATNNWGVKITRVEIKDIAPPADLVDAMARQMKADRDKKAAILEAEGHKQSAILKAEGLKEAAILKAEGEKEAAYRKAEARERQARAEAEATTMVSDAIAKGDLNAINYFVAQKYVDSFTQLASAPNQKVFIMPMESTALLGSLAGVAELLKNTGSLAESGSSEAPAKQADAPEMPDELKVSVTSPGVRRPLVKNPKEQ